MLAKALVAAGGASAPAAAVAAALRGYEAERVARAMPVTVKSQIMGAMLQIRFPGVRQSRLVHIPVMTCTNINVIYPPPRCHIISPCNRVYTLLLKHKLKQLLPTSWMDSYPTYLLSLASTQISQCI